MNGLDVFSGGTYFLRITALYKEEEHDWKRTDRCTIQVMGNKAHETCCLNYVLGYLFLGSGLYGQLSHRTHLAANKRSFW